MSEDKVLNINKYVKYLRKRVNKLNLYINNEEYNPDIKRLKTETETIKQQIIKIEYEISNF